MKQTCLLILGMHRSGTSAITGVLSLLDVYLGSELLTPLEQNAKGFFENRHLYGLNENYLQQMDSSWDDIFYAEDKLKKITDISELENFLESEFKYSRCFCIKDPRLAYLFPLYVQALSNKDIDVKVIIPIRNPIEVAASLKARDGFSFEKSMLLWLEHFFRSEEHSRNYPRVFTSFDGLISNPEKVIAQIDSALDLNLLPLLKERKEEVVEFLTPGLKHHNVSTNNLSLNVPEPIRRVMEWLPKLNTGDYTKKFDSFRQEYFNYSSVFYNREIITDLEMLPQVKDELTNYKASLESCEGELVDVRNELSSRNQELTDTNTALTVRSQELFATRSELEVRTQELSDTHAALVARNEEVIATRSELVARNEEMAATRSELEVRTQELSDTHAALVARSEELAATRSELEARSQELADTHAALVVRDQEVAAIRSEFEASTKDLVSTRDVLMSREQELRSMRKQLNQRIAETSEAHGKLREYCQAISESETRVSELSIEVAKLLEQLDATEDRLAASRDELINVYLSKSWAVTRPMRRVMRSFRK